mmetsp:Transcript_12019/g.17578  ORF Transcript_12019/g.17578 Transcript_12019/m.17578 type:complete len:253 (-) Transcript_12019:3000-3758(-)
MRAAFSRASPSLMRIPYLAATPVVTIITVGTASPKAHGQAITRTEIPNLKANKNSVSFDSSITFSKASVGLYASENQIIQVKIANKTTPGTKILEILSATAWIGGLVACAFSTSEMIWASAVSFPNFSTFTLTTPFMLMVPPNTFEPSDLKTKEDSPVIIASLTQAPPSTTTPSTGTEDPGYTLTKSPTSNKARSSCTSFPSCRSTACEICKLESLVMASVVFFLDLDSRYFPSSMIEISSEEVSNECADSM